MQGQAVVRVNRTNGAWGGEVKFLMKKKSF
jgi:hypothetical protein